MNIINEELLLKKQLLCSGFNISEKAKHYISKNDLLINNNKSVHACILMLPNGNYVNAIVGEGFCKASPFFLDVINNQLFIIKNNQPVSKVSLPKKPKWYDKYTRDNILMSNILSLHGANTLAFTNHNSCCFKLNGEGCLFCSSNQAEDVDWKVQTKRIEEILGYALEENNSYSLALSGGTRVGEDRGILYFSYLVDYIKRRYPEIKISVETVPPQKLIYLNDLVDAGVSSVIMNLELFSNENRKKYCPGKFKIQKEEYYASYEFLTHKLGPWQVGSVLIAGLEPVECTILGAKKMIDLSVQPTVMPFRPYDLSVLCNKAITDYKLLVYIENELNKYLKAKNINVCQAFGCLSCNACIGNKL